MVITHSEIHMFLTCRRKWEYYSLQDYSKPEKFDGPLALGSRVHAALEQFYRDGVDPVEVHDTLALQAVKDAEASGLSFFDQLYDDIVVGRNCVKAHQQWLEDTGADSNFEVAMVEEKLEAPILDGRAILRGKVDMMFREIDTGFLILNDLKTTSVWQGGLREILERSYQHHVYLALANVVSPDKNINGATYTVIKKVKNLSKVSGPLVERFRVPATRRAADEKLRQIEAIATEMLRARDEFMERGATRLTYPSPQMECRWCEYKHPCELADESPRAAYDMLAREYVKGIRYARYEEAANE